MRPDDTLTGIGSQKLPARQAVFAHVLVAPMADGLRPFWAAAEEVTHGGVFVRTRNRLEVDTLVMLELVFPDLPGPKLRLDALVVHQVPGAGFGCQFVAPTEHATRRLSEVVAHASAAPKVARG